MKQLATSPLLLLTFLLSSFCLNAQLLKKEKLGLIEYHQPQNSTVLNDLSTYKLNIINTKGSSDFPSFQLKGFTRVQHDEENDFYLEFEEVKMSTGLSSCLELTNDKSNETLYRRENTIRCVYQMLVLDKTLDTLYRAEERVYVDYSGLASIDKTDANMSFYNTPVPYNKAIKEVLNRLAGKFEVHFNGIQRTTDLNIYQLNLEDTETFKKAVRELKAGCRSYKSNGIDSLTTKHLNDAEFYFLAFLPEIEKKKCSTARKRKLRYATRSNLAYVYFLKGNFELMYKYLHANTISPYVLRSNESKNYRIAYRCHFQMNLNQGFLDD